MVTIFQKRPAGIMVLGVLCVCVGAGTLLSPLNKPLVLGGMMYTERTAIMLRILLSIVVIYVGYGLLKPIQHIWYLYLTGACLSIMSLKFNLLHESKIWELYLFLTPSSESIPRLVTFTIDTHYLFMAVYALTAVYIYLQKPYFWSNEDINTDA